MTGKFNLRTLIILLTIVMIGAGCALPGGSSEPTAAPINTLAQTAVASRPTEEPAPTKTRVSTQTLTATAVPEFVLPLSSGLREQFNALRDTADCPKVDSDEWSGRIEFDAVNRTATIYANKCELHLKVGNAEYKVIAVVGAFLEGGDPLDWIEGDMWTWTVPVAADGTIWGIESGKKNWLDPNGILMLDGGFEIEPAQGTQRDAFMYFRTSALATNTPTVTPTRTASSTPTATRTPGATATLLVLPSSTPVPTNTP